MKRAVFAIIVGAALLAFLVSLTPAQGDGPYPVETILPPPILWTATPPYTLSLAEIKR